MLNQKNKEKKLRVKYVLYNYILRKINDKVENYIVKYVLSFMTSSD